MRCIFCLRSDVQLTDEHIFQRAVGGNLYSRTTCKPCNDKLGRTVDVTVTNHQLVEQERWRLGIRGRTGALPDPFADGFVDGDPQKPAQMKFDSSGPARPYLKQRVMKLREGVYRIQLDASEKHRVVPILNKLQSRNGFPLLTEEQIRNLKPPVRQTQNPEIHFNWKVDEHQFRRGLLKIAYELAHRWLGDTYLDDPMAVLIRGFILDDELPVKSHSKHRIPMVPMVGKQISKALPFWPKESLIGCSSANGSDLNVQVSVLGVLGLRGTVTENIGSYAEVPNMFLLIDPVSHERRESTLDEEDDRLHERGDVEAFWPSA
jgi:HNH endonuclease